MPNYTVEVVTEQPHQLGEGPFWDEKASHLYYVDAFRGDICKLDPVTKVLEKANFDDTVTFVIPVENSTDDFLISKNKEVLKYNWTSQETTKLGVVDEHTTKTRFNDGKCDPTGRLWAGTMGIEISPGVVEADLGSLYQINGNYKISKQVGNVSLSNGLTWSSNKNLMYYIDSTKRHIYVFDYNDQTGSVENQRVFFDFNGNDDCKSNELPDGMTIALDDKLWVACYDGGRIINIDPETAKIVDAIELPATKTTSLCFGGRDLNQFFVTSGTLGLNPEERSAQPDAGSIFKVTFDKANIRGANNQRFVSTE